MSQDSALASELKLQRIIKQDLPGLSQSYRKYRKKLLGKGGKKFSDKWCDSKHTS